MDNDTLDSKGRKIKMVNRIQVNRNIVNVEILKEVKNHLIAPWQRNLLFITSVVAVGLGFLILCSKNFTRSCFIVFGYWMFCGNLLFKSS